MHWPLSDWRRPINPPNNKLDGFTARESHIDRCDHSWCGWPPNASTHRGPPCQGLAWDQRNGTEPLSNFSTVFNRPDSGERLG